MLVSWRTERYAHLSDKRFQQIVALVRRTSSAWQIKGAPHSTIGGGFEFDIELEDGAKLPAKAVQAACSPKHREKQIHHIKKNVEAGHIAGPLPASETGTMLSRPHIVWKKDDELGRWIVDFRLLNRLTKRLRGRSPDLW